MVKTLKLNKEFRRLYYKGTYKTSGILVTYGEKKRKSGVRIGITTGKKIGNAVERNRARRVIRAAFFQLQKEMNLEGYDFVFVARSAILEKKTADVFCDMKKQICFIQNRCKEK